MRHHYDLPAEFFALFLDESMTYSCAVFSRGATTLEEAQETKLELVCTKLGLEPGERLLDVGCGWGSFAVHAAVNHGVHVTGITLSGPQAERARARAEEAGVADRVDIRVQDWRELAGERFDAIASIGMVEHVGNVQIDAYAQRLRDLLEPERAPAQPRHRPRAPRRPRGRAVLRALRLPRRRPAALARACSAPSSAPACPPTTSRASSPTTPRRCATGRMRLDENLDRALELAGAERVRIWRLYLRAARQGFVDRLHLDLPGPRGADGRRARPRRHRERATVSA